MIQRIAVSTAVLLVFFLALNPVFGQASPLTNPTWVQVYDAEGYQSVIETNDQFYVVVFDIHYSDAADRPAENASDTFIVRLTSSSGNHALSTPVSWVHRGYTRGLIGFYFPAADGDLPTWADATLVADVIGNPALAWAGGQPLSNQQNPDDNTGADFDAQQSAIETFLRGALPQIENNWFEAIGEVVDLLAGQPAVLTSVGEEYMALASPDQYNLTPDLYVFSSANPNLVVYGLDRLTVAAVATDTSITVSDASQAGFLANQDIMLVGSATFETVTVSGVVGEVVSFAPGLSNPYSVGDRVYITSQALQNDLDSLTSGSFIAVEIMSRGATAFGLSETMFGILLTTIAALFTGGLIGIGVRGLSPYTFPVALTGIFLVMVLCTALGLIDVIVLGLFGTLMVMAAVWEQFWKNVA